MPEQIELTKISRDGGTQSRAWLNNQTIDEYAAAMRRGEEFPPIKLIYTGEAYYLVDGFHRVEAAIKAKLERISAEVEPGTLEDAQWLSYAANPTHGLPRSTEDKRRAIRAALKHPKGVEKSDREIAAHIRVDHKTVGNIRKEMVERGEIPKLEERIGADGKTYKVPVQEEPLNDWKAQLTEWANGFGEGELLLIKMSDDSYLAIEKRWSSVLSSRFGLLTGNLWIQGVHDWETTVSLDLAYVEALRADGCTIQIVDLESLPKIIGKLARLADKASRLNRYKPMGFEVKPGDLLQDNSGVYRVLEISHTLLTLCHVESDKPFTTRWGYAEPFAPIEFERGKKNELNYTVTQRFNQGGNWKQRYEAIKRWYAADALLLYEVGNRWIALGEDAEWLATTDLGIAHQDEQIAAYIVVNDGKTRVVRESPRPVVVYSIYGSSDAERWVDKIINNLVKQALKPAPAAPAPAHSPTGEGETVLDVLAILYELQEQRGGWIGGALINLNGTEAGLLEQQRIIKLQRRAPSGGIMAWYQITPAGCYDLQRPVLPVAPAPQDEYYPSPDAKAERSSVIFQLNERLIEVRDLLQRLESLDSDLHGQLNIAYTTMRVQVFQALETPGTIEELEQFA